MADEFVANVGSEGCLSLEKLGSTLCLTNRYIIERGSQTEIALRFSSKERRPDWPEDFTLTCEVPTLLLTVHAATRQEREQIIRDVESVLRYSGNGNGNGSVPAIRQLPLDTCSGGWDSGARSGCFGTRET